MFNSIIKRSSILKCYNIGKPKKRKPYDTVDTDGLVLKKSLRMIEQSKNKEQLDTAKKFMDLFLKGIDCPFVISDLHKRWQEKDRKLMVI